MSPTVHEELREALESAGISTEKLSDDAVLAVARALFAACADFGVALAQIFADGVGEVGARLHKLADFCEVFERAAKAEAGA